MGTVHLVAHRVQLLKMQIIANIHWERGGRAQRCKVPLTILLTTRYRGLVCLDQVTYSCAPQKLRMPGP